MRPSHGTVLGTLPRMLVAYAEAVHDVPADALYADAGIDPAPLFADAEARVPRPAIDALWAAVEARTGDPAIGVNFALRLPPGNAGVLEYVATSCATIGEAWGFMVRYWRLLNEDADLRIERRADEARIVLRPTNGEPFHRQWIEFTVAALALAARPFEHAGHRFTEVCVPHARGAAGEQLEALVAAPVRYGQPAMELGLPYAVAALPMPSANPALRDVLVAHAETKLSQLRERGAEEPEAEPPASGADLRARVQAEIERRLAAGDATLEGVARALGTSARSLQRHLAAHGSSHRELLDAARHAAAVRHLSGHALSVTDVACVLGFSELSAFHRAFRRWTGMAPSEFRARRAGAIGTA